MELNKLSSPTMNLNVFPFIQHVPYFNQNVVPHNLDSHHQYLPQKNLEQHFLTLPPPLSNPFHLFPGFIPPMHPISLFSAQQHLLKVQQLQQAFQQGIERSQSSNSLKPSALPQNRHYQVYQIGNKEPKDSPSLKQKSETKQDLISHWDPWFHRRAKKDIKKANQKMNKSTINSQLRKIRKSKIEPEKKITKRCLQNIASEKKRNEYLDTSEFKSPVILQNVGGVIETKSCAVSKSDEDIELSIKKKCLDNFDNRNL